MGPCGWGEGKPQAPAPHLTAGTGLSRHRCGATTARAWYHPFRSLRGPELQTPASRVSEPRVLRDPAAQTPTSKLKDPKIQVPSAPFWRSRESGTAAELPAPGFEEFRILDRSFPPGLPRSSSTRLPGLEELGIWTPSAPTGLFWADGPTTSRGPRNLRPPCAPSWRCCNPGF